MTINKFAEPETPDTDSGGAEGTERTEEVVTPEDIQAVIVSCDAYEARMRKARETRKERE